MNIIEKATVKHYYQHRLKQWHYSDAQRQGWTDVKVQELRFEAMAALADFNNKSVMDVGCGYGDFRSFLDDRFQRFDYIGIDQQSEFIAVAKQKYKGEQGVWFYEADATKCGLPKMDIVIACGFLSYYSHDQDYYQGMIQQLYEASNYSFIFNMLDNQAFKSTKLIVAHDKEKIFDYCCTFSDRVALKDDYLDIDFTICMEK